jgi:hypothetical protein
VRMCDAAAVGFLCGLRLLPGRAKMCWAVKISCATAARVFGLGSRCTLEHGEMETQGYEETKTHMKSSRHTEENHTA